ncbi:MAG: phthiocerol/phthiodiolone dimycocerosyl transferase family protein, partial [Xenococcaceae cyanobacterium]
DGLSSCYLLRDIVEAIAFPNLHNLSLPEYPPFENLIPNLNQPQGDRLPTEFVPALTEKPVILSFEIDPRIMCWSLPSSKTTLLIDRARQEKTTVHGAICAAFLLAIASTLKLSTLKCQSPINIRKYLTPAIEEDFGFYFSVGITEHFLDDIAQGVRSHRQYFWGIARSLKKQLKEKMHPDRIFASIPDRQALMSTKPTPSQIQQLFHSDEYYYDLVVTNLGRLNFPKHYGTIELKAVYGPAAMNHIFNDLIVGVTSVGNEIFFTLTYSASKPIALEVNNIKLEAIEHLNRALF